ncbi:hypothetical protein BBD41_01175 [Paenibacillus ihbetae]|uniref:Uncharacterized protein n=1 Tax=Paenibacillus ihbetae TaxID=1870820 RepID=A0A1B2DUB5_9BACL|nr:hypothetical protein [Paenibacillus ihbetae]ANY71308.1 hypothetical protein BBD41_01175 [Paenibacillus ihbetae]
MKPKPSLWRSTLVILMVIGGADYAAADQGRHYEAISKEHQVTSTSNQISAMIPLRQVATDIGALVALESKT